MRIRLGGDPVKFYLLELKCIHLSAAWYGQDAGCQREEARGKSCVPVEKRAKAVAAEYVKKAQETDQTYCGTAPGEIGPVEAKLRSFEKSVPLVFGAFGEASDGVEQLIDALAEAGADVHWRGMKAKKREEAKGALVAYLRRRWGAWSQCAGTRSSPSIGCNSLGKRAARTRKWRRSASAKGAR